jgi:hypothetical protein
VAGAIVDQLLTQGPTESANPGSADSLLVRIGRRGTIADVRPALGYLELDVPRWQQLLDADRVPTTLQAAGADR